MNRRSFLKAAPLAPVTATLTIREDGKPPIEGLDVSVLRLQPGDVVVLRVAHLTHEAADNLQWLWAHRFPAIKAVVLSDDVTIDAVIRP